MKYLDTSFMLDKMMKDVKQMKYNLKKIGLEKSLVWNCVDNLEDAIDDYYN